MGGEGLNRTHLWVDAKSGQIFGYFALAPTVVTTDSLLSKTAPGLLLAKMALSEDLRGEDPPWGPRLLLAAFEVVVQAADLVAGKFLAVDAQHERTFDFYKRNGFEPVEASRIQLLMRISTIRKIFAE
ncbi:MAG: GCN5-related N-acetyltransferase [Marmoricola sp.]|nr:GCN5-related N-acetyltransferase [Marmoricola sp.]